MLKLFAAKSLLCFKSEHTCTYIELDTQDQDSCCGQQLTLKICPLAQYHRWNDLSSPLYILRGQRLLFPSIHEDCFNPYPAEHRFILLKNTEDPDQLASDEAS